MTWRDRLEEHRRRQQVLDELNAQRLEIERLIVLWVLPLSIVAGVCIGVTLWLLR